MRRRSWAFLAFALAAGCAEVGKPPAPAAKAPPQVEAPSGEPKLKESTLKLLAARNLKPHTVRPLNVRSSCAHKDEIGTSTRLDLLVDDTLVKTFSAEVSIKGRGTCRFSLDEFEQAAAKAPPVLLRHKANKDCSVRMWEEGEQQVAIAFNSCPKSCEGDAFTYLWPILVEAKSGRCF